jgi:hypothetical protein
LIARGADRLAAVGADCGPPASAAQFAMAASKFGHRHRTSVTAIEIQTPLVPTPAMEAWNSLLHGI